MTVERNGRVTIKDVYDLHIETKDAISDMRIEFKTEMAELKTEVKTDISVLKVKLAGIIGLVSLIMSATVYGIIELIAKLTGA